MAENRQLDLFARTGNLRRRRIVNRVLEIAAWVAAVIAVGTLAVVIISVILKGVGSINLEFLTTPTSPFGAGGGISNAIIGTGILVAVATAIAVPLGMLIAIYTSELAGPRLGFAVRYVLDVLNGVPTIIVGIFVFGLLVVGHQQSGFAGSIALAIVMLPLVARSSHEVLSLVPGTVKEAATALGASRWRTVLTVVVPTAFSGMITGALLAVARAAGETAPLLFTTSIFPNLVQTNLSQALPNIPVTIFQFSESPEPAKHAQAWAAALVLIVFVLLINVIARSFLARSRRQLGAGR
ncbi:MAG TPA: phosphate ABC transporter permease PstA [Actinomycetota bacterium]|jgi:phosphate transport system permease protein|nr:phosphate ABC transporter permease PstA [Actinomycetota bacterium]